jgi:hypothetical protein
MGVIRLRNAKTIGVLLGAVVALAAVLPLAMSVLGPRAVDTVPWIGPFLWEARALDVLVQGLILLAAVLGVLVILGRQP